MPPFFAAFARVASSLFFLTILFPLFKKPMTLPTPMKRRAWFNGLLFIGFPFAFLFWGEQFISAGLTSIINGTVPLWTSVMALIFLKSDEKWSLKRIFGLALGFVGLCFIFAPKLSWAGHALEFLGSMAVLGMVLSYSAGNILGRKVLAGKYQANVYGAVYQQHLAGVLFLFVLCLVTKQFPTSIPSTSSLISTLYLGLFSTALGLIFFMLLIKAWGTVRASLVTYCMPLVTLSVDYFIYGNILGFWELTGGIIVLLGLFLIQSKVPVRSST